MAKYFVTGAAGFIASKVSELLLAAGHSIVGLDNLNDAYDVRLKNWRLARLTQIPNFSFHTTDITDRAALQKLFEDNDAEGAAGIINFAARAGVRQSVENPWIYLDVNTTGTLNLLDICHRFGIKKFLLASTSSLYGANNPQPFKEEANTDGPLSPYAASKKAAEGLCYTYHYLYGLDISIPRFFTVYGPAGRPDMSLFRFVQWISEGRPVKVFGDGRQKRDFTYVEDIARGVIAGMKPTGYEIFNLGSDQPVILADAIHLIEELIGKKAILEYQPRHPADVLETWANVDKAHELLQWRPQVSFEEGVKSLVDWYKENESWARDISTG